MKTIITAILAGAALGCAVQAGARDYRVTDYGVRANDSTRLQTEKIQAVIDRAEADGGGTVVLPKGTYLSGALFFKPGTKLRVEQDAKLKGSDDIKNFPLIPSRMEGRSIYYHAALVNAYHVDGFSITGPGTIDGNGLKYWKEFWDLRRERAKVGKSCTNLEVRRPRLVFLWGCDSVTLKDVKMCNSPFWTNHLYQCNHVVFDGCSITAPNKPIKAPSSDAIDLDVCSHITVRNCYISVNDDGVCVKGGKGVYANRSAENGTVSHLLVENCTFGPACHGILTLGSECIHATDIILRNCTADCHCSILRLKMRPDTYQIYENITVSNVTGRVGSVIQMKPWTQFFTLEGSNEKPYGIVRNILIEDINVACDDLGTIAGNPDDRVSDVTLRNITLRAKNPDYTCIYPQVRFENVKINE